MPTPTVSNSIFNEVETDSGLTVYRRQVTYATEALPRPALPLTTGFSTKDSGPKFIRYGVSRKAGVLSMVDDWVGLDVPIDERDTTRFRLTLDISTTNAPPLDYAFKVFAQERFLGMMRVAAETPITVLGSFPLPGSASGGQGSLELQLANGIHPISSGQLTVSLNQLEVFVEDAT